MEKEGRVGVWLLVAALAAFAGVIAPNVFERAGEAMIPAALPAGDAATSADSLPSGASPTPDPPPDATGQAFEAVSAGDCLAVYDTGTGAWSAHRPRRVDCGEADAYVKVSAVEMQAADCPQGAGQSFWGYARGVHTVALCLTRRFEVGSCLLADETRGSDGEDEPEMQAGLLTVADCEAGEVPEGYNRVLRITGVYDAPEEMSGPLCARGPQDTTSYWYWFVENAEDTEDVENTDDEGSGGTDGSEGTDGGSGDAQGPGSTAGAGPTEGPEGPGDPEGAGTAGTPGAAADGGATEPTDSAETTGTTGSTGSTGATGAAETTGTAETLLCTTVAREVTS
ncbi:LppU/SCO3897 family protein [Streptomyces hoynatensis]|uniref:Uncharacterized protein n=1 Tax=Streptomyces hoynatensis TaxID=1141874 RepID=A0A3A9ZFF4_9ACTN|nr:hypothetical protein [Streptomyces hoynatensis]RKN46895.1 hypothetical protein D7294_01395 [Streptomyces hoynatensis]